jgi:NIPSNAP
MSIQKKILLSGAALGIFAVGIATGIYMPQAQSATKTPDRVFELRTYTTNEGKLDDLHARFRDDTMRIFEKHGITNIAYWTPLEGDRKGHTLVYLISHESREAAKANWAAFGRDPEWRKVFKASRANGALVKKVDSQFLEAAEYSPLQ